MSPLLSIEALAAKHGDCLLAHFGDPGHPETLLIDGGPATTYAEVLAPRLKELALERGPDPVSVPIVLATHIDADHIAGLIDLTGTLLEGPFGPQLDVGTLWHNSFSDPSELTTDAEIGDEDLALAALFETRDLRPAAALVIASIPQGERLVDNAQALAWPLNTPFQQLVRAEDPAAVSKLGPLEIRVLLPDEKRLAELKDEWLKEAAVVEAGARPKPDDHIPNLASIVCLLELEQKRVLLTGDARGDHIVDALETAGLLRPGATIEVDLVKLPHHGSIRNVIDTGFFERLHADHYLISADGLHDNPDVATLRMLSESRTDDDFTIHMTYAPEELRGDASTWVRDFFAAERDAGRRYRVCFRPTGELSLSVNLLQPLR